MKCEYCQEDLTTRYTSQILLDDIHVRHCRERLANKLREIAKLVAALKHEATHTSDLPEFVLDCQVRMSDILMLIEEP